MLAGGAWTAEQSSVVPSRNPLLLFTLACSAWAHAVVAPLHWPTAPGAQHLFVLPCMPTVQVVTGLISQAEAAVRQLQEELFGNGPQPAGASNGAAGGSGEVERAGSTASFMDNQVRWL